MENIDNKNKYLKCLCVQSDIFHEDEITDEHKGILKEFFDQENNYKKYDNTKSLFDIYFNTSKNYNYMHENTYSFYIIIYFNYFEKENNINLVSMITQKFDELKEKFEFLNELKKSVFNLDTWKVKNLTLFKDILLQYDYCNYIEIIENLNFKYSNLKLIYDNGNMFYFYPNTKGRNPKDILRKTKYIQLFNRNKMIKLRSDKPRVKKLPENILSIQMKLKLNTVNDKILTQVFELEENKNLRFIDVLNDYQNGGKRLKEYFETYLKNSCSFEDSEVLYNLDKKEVYKYLDKHKDKSVRNNKTLFFIIISLLSDLNYSNSILSSIEKFLKDKMSRPQDVMNKIQIIKRLKDNIRKRDLTFTNAELSKELYNKIFTINNEVPIADTTIDFDIEDFLSLEGFTSEENFLGISLDEIDEELLKI